MFEYGNTKGTVSIWCKEKGLNWWRYFVSEGVELRMVYKTLFASTRRPTLLPYQGSISGGIRPRGSFLQYGVGDTIEGKGRCFVTTITRVRCEPEGAESYVNDA